MMRARTAALAAGLAGLASAGALQAHHSGSMYATTPLWVRGSVVSFDLVNPHSLTTVEGSGEDGQVHRWIVEGPPQIALQRRATDSYVPKVGDVVEFCAFPYKSVEQLSRLFPGTDFSNRRSLAAPDGSSPRYVAGHVVTTADGQKRMWEPHGIVAECIRAAADERAVWSSFVNANTEAHDAWCSQKGYAVIRSTPALQEFVEQFDSSLENPCK